MTSDAEVRLTGRPGLVIVLLAALIGCAALWSLDRAARRPFWFDEILTIAVSSQPSGSAIRQALQYGADASPLLFHTIEHAAGRLPLDRHIAYRLPSILAFCLTLIGLFLFVGRSTGTVPALVAVLLAFTTQMFTVYAVEARPYSMMVCAAMWGIVMWQRVERSAYFSVLCAACLCLAASLHYYGVLISVPLAVAELTRLRRTRQVRALVWVALACPLVPLAVAWPLGSRIMAEYGAHFWARPPVAGFLRVYDLFLNVNNWWGAAAAFVLIGTLTIRLRTHRAVTLERDDPRAEDYALVIGLLVLPAAAYFVAHFAGVGITARYVLPTALGIAAGTAFVTTPSRRASWLLICGIFGRPGAQSVGGAIRHRRGR